MKNYVNKDTKVLLIHLSIVLLVLVIIGQLFAVMISYNYKQMMFSHDNAVAGYLKQLNVDESIIQKAFTSDKSSENIKSGEALLHSIGYSNELQEDLLADVKELHSKYAIYLFFITVLAAISILTLNLCYFFRLGKKLKKASEDINSFMSGNTDIRLGQPEEGSLSKLFNSINGLATSLNSHIVKEVQNKEFLKDTISNISHQLKTPLAALRLYNEIIQAEQTENQVIKDFLVKTDRELNRMENLIHNLLKLARLDSGSIVLEKKCYKLKIFMEELVEGFRTRAKSEDKFLKMNCDDQMTLSYDEEWLYEAVSNIIKNAFDHTQAQDQIDITCRETLVFKEIIIKDNGSGIHPEDITSIFKRFYRSRFSKDKQGIGIGLTLAKMIIERHDGSINVESELGKGTIFYIVFPKLTNM